MSQPLGKKKGFIAPFQAPSRSQHLEQKGPVSVNPVSTKSTPVITPDTSSSEPALPVTSKKPKKKRPTVSSLAGDCAPTSTKKPTGHDAEWINPTDLGVTTTSKAPEPFSDIISDKAKDGPAAAKKPKSSKKAKVRQPCVSGAAEVCGQSGPDSTLKGPPPAPGAASDGDEACAPAAEPALPVGSALTASAPVDFTPPDAPATSLSSPPAVFKRPNPSSAVPSDPETGPPPVKRRLYSGKGRADRGSGSGVRDRPRPPAAAAPDRPDQKARLLALQARRTCGTWVQCCHMDCGKWRYLATVRDPCVLPQVWHCTMNDDAKYGWCSAPQEHIPNSSFPRLVAVRYTVGSVVWAHLDGFPWWPAIVDDDPDTEEFFWLDGFSETPTHYHVAFLDASSHAVTRAWVTPTQVKKFEAGDQLTARGKSRCRGVEYRARLEAALRQAREALSCPLEERRCRFTFVARYPGPWPVYSDSDAETGRMPDGRRPARKRRRDRRRPKCSTKPSQVSVVRDRSPPRPTRRDSSSSSSGSSRDDETVNSLMDVVDDIVQQLTQSQSQSQSQSRHSQGGAGDAAPMFTDSGPSDSDVDREISAADSPAGPAKAAAAPTDVWTAPKPKAAGKPNKSQKPAAGDSVTDGSVSAAAPSKSQAAASVQDGANKPKQAAKPNKSKKASAVEGEASEPKPAATPKKSKKAAAISEADGPRADVTPKKSKKARPVSEAEGPKANVTPKKSKKAPPITEADTPTVDVTPKKSNKAPAASEADTPKADVTPKKSKKALAGEGETDIPKKVTKPKKSQKAPVAEGETEKSKPAFTSKKKSQKASIVGCKTGNPHQNATSNKPDTAPAVESETGNSKPAAKPNKSKKTSPLESGGDNAKPAVTPKKKSKKTPPAEGDTVAPKLPPAPGPAASVETDGTCWADPESGQQDSDGESEEGGDRGSAESGACDESPEDGAEAGDSRSVKPRQGDGDRRSAEPGKDSGDHGSVESSQGASDREPEESGDEPGRPASPWLRSPAGAALLTGAASPSPPAGSSPLLAPATPSPRDYTELQSELTSAQSQELFEPAGASQDGYESDPFEAYD